MGDFRAELAALVAAYNEHGGGWTQEDVYALWDAVEHARDVLAAEPQIEAPGWCETDAEQYAWQAGWEARDDAMLQPSLPVARLPENAQAIEPANRTILVPIPAPIPVSERLPEQKEMTDDGKVWVEYPGGEYPVGDNDFDWEPHKWILSPIEKPTIRENRRWLPAHALPLPEVE